MRTPRSIWPFFFQAEDGIRDGHVTGVQTCALPICARPEAYDLKGRTGSLGQIPLIVVDDGVSYVAADRLAALLKGAWATKGTRGTLTVGKQTAQFFKDQSRVLIQGQPLALDGPPRVGAAGWLLPESFLGKGLGRLAPGVSAVAVASDPKKPKAV